MTAFLTGSRVYGTLNDKSDTDLVVLVDAETLRQLIEHADTEADLGAPGGPHYEDGMSLRFGGLNLICVTDEKHFNVWKKGTDDLIAAKPVTRDFAIDFLKRLRAMHKIGGW